MLLTCMIKGTAEGFQPLVHGLTVLVHVCVGECVCAHTSLDHHVTCQRQQKSKCPPLFFVRFCLLQCLTSNWKQRADVTARRWLEPVNTVNCVASELLSQRVYTVGSELVHKCLTSC